MGQRMGLVGGEGARRRGEGGFTLVELLVTLAVFGLMYAGVHGLFTSAWTTWRRGNQSAALYDVGLGLVDSITRDARAAKSLQGTTGANGSVNGLVLVMNSPARKNATTGWYDQKTVTYQNTGSGFTRVVKIWQTDNLGLVKAGPVFESWTLTRSVANFQSENMDLTNYPRVLRFWLFMHKDGMGAWPSYQYKINGRAWVRRNNADVPDAVSY